MPARVAYTLSFPAMSPEQRDDFMSQYRGWEKKVEAEYRASVSDNYFDSVTKHSINMRTMLDKLPKGIRDDLMNEYKTLIRFDEVIERSRIGGPNKASDAALERRMRWLKGPGDDRPYGQFAVKQADIDSRNPLAVIYNRMYVQMRRDPRTGERVFGTGTNVLRPDYFEDMLDKKPLTPGAKILVFDTETAGLELDSGIRQVSSYRMGVDASGRITAPTDPFDVHFNTTRMQMGYLRDSSGNTKPMNTAIRDLFDIKKLTDRTPGLKGDSFARGMRPFLEQLIEADVVVGQNIQFDIDQILVGLTNTSEYLEGKTDFRGLLDEARESFASKAKRDTLEMARDALPKLDVAKEISFLGKGTQHSLANLMLQTNLVDLLARDIGRDELVSLLGGGGNKAMMHASNVDALIEAHLYQYLEGEELTAGKAKMFKSKVGRVIRRSILTSYAPTPISNIRNVEHINPELFKLLDDEGAVEVMGGRGTLSASELYDHLQDPDSPFYKVSVTPYEQGIWAGRQAGLAAGQAVSGGELAFSQGQFRELTGVNKNYQGFLNKDFTMFQRGVRPSEAAFAKFQERMAQQAMPYAGVSFEERWLSTAVSGAGGLSSSLDEVLGPLEKGVATIGEDTLLGRFRAYGTPYVAKSGNVTLPHQVLREAGIDVDKVGMSPYMTRKGNKRVNLFADVTDEDIGKIGEFLRTTDLDAELSQDTTLRKLGFTRSHVRDVLQSLPESGPKRGISIGFLDREAGARVYDVFHSMHQGLTEDDALLKFRAKLIDSDNGVLRTGAFVLDRFLTPAQEAEYFGKGADVAMERVSDLEKFAENSKRVGVVKHMMRNPRGETIKSVTRAIDDFLPHAPKALGIGAVIGAGLLLYKRNKEQNFYDETIEQQPLGRVSRNDSMRQLNRPPSRTMDPLATGGVVNAANNGSIGHTTMGAGNRYSNLYGGAL